MEGAPHGAFAEDENCHYFAYDTRTDDCWLVNGEKGPPQLEVSENAIAGPLACDLELLGRKAPHSAEGVTGVTEIRTSSPDQLIPIAYLACDAPGYTCNDPIH